MDVLSCLPALLTKKKKKKINAIVPVRELKHIRVTNEVKKLAGGSSSLTFAASMSDALGKVTQNFYGALLLYSTITVYFRP